ncbi:MAG: cation diffusion facilitator family transporter, partial [bacterium]
MHNHDEHEHEHGNEQNRDGYRRRLMIVLVITSVYFVAEVVGGLLTNSLALLSDAGHMLTDIAAMLVAMFAYLFAQRPANARKSYGYHRLEILAALFNGVALLSISGFIIWEAIIRLRQPPAVGGEGLLIIAIGGLVVNLVAAAVLHRGHEHSLNMRAVFYHVLGDTLGSVAAIAAGVLILLYNWRIADPILAILISILILFSAYSLLREAVDVLLEATPKHIDVEEIRLALMEIKGVTEVHDLHVWTITSGNISLSCHVVLQQCDFCCG